MDDMTTLMEEEGMKNGICIIGTAYCDIVYPIVCYPNKNELTTITEKITYAVAGSLYHMVSTLSALDIKLSLQAYATIGDDMDGDFIEQKLADFDQLSLAGIKRANRTSFIMTMRDQESDTIFQYRCKTSKLLETDFDFRKMDVKMVHIEALAELLEPDSQYGTKLSALLSATQSTGTLTSVCIPGSTEADSLFQILRYADYGIISLQNLLAISDVEIENNSKVDLSENLRRVFYNLRQKESSIKWLLVYSENEVYGIDFKMCTLRAFYSDGSIYTESNMYRFYSGVLYGAYHGKMLTEAMEIGKTVLGS